MRFISIIPTTYLFLGASVFAQEKTTEFVAQPTVAIAKVITGLVLVLVLIAAFAWLSKRLGYAGGGLSKENMKVLGVLSLGAREKAVLVEVAGHKLLLGVAPGRVNQLHVFEKTEMPQQSVDKDSNSVAGTNEDHSIEKNSSGSSDSSGNKSATGKDFAVYLKQILSNGSERP